MRFYLSKFLLMFGLAGATAGTAGIIFIGWLAYVLGARYDASAWLLALLWSSFAILALGYSVLWRSVIRMIRSAAEPVISFETNSVTYRLNTGKVIFTPFSEIRGVEVESFGPKFGGGHILIHKSDSHTDQIYIFNLSAPKKEVFLAFKENLPHLVQPYSTVQRLIYAA
jgi:hypothetical protein